MRTQPSSQSYLLRLQGLLRPVCAETAGPGSDADVALETAENGGLPVAIQGWGRSNAEDRHCVEHELGMQSTSTDL